MFVAEVNHCCLLDLKMLDGEKNNGIESEFTVVLSKYSVKSKAVSSASIRRSLAAQPSALDDEANWRIDRFSTVVETCSFSLLGSPLSFGEAFVFLLCKCDFEVYKLRQCRR